MNFLYPLGLLGLIGVPILIIIYIIKNKYMEQTIASTYIWTVSERFLKRKRPINKIAGIISLILQILSVVCISVALAHPVLLQPGAAERYCFILDASGSMNMQTGDITRFERGKQQIADMIINAAKGSQFTIVYADETVAVTDTTSDVDTALKQLDELQPTFVEMNTENAIDRAQKLFSDNPTTLVYLFTDVAYDSYKNVNVVNLAEEEINYSVTELTYKETTDKTGYDITCTVHAYGVDAQLNVDLYVDDTQTPATTQTVQTQEGVATFTHTVDGAFTYVRAAIREDDDLADDNEYVLYNVKESNAYTALIVSEEPFFLETVVKVMGGKAEVVDPDTYTPRSGYDLYIFDGYAPEAMPDDGAVWFFGIDENVPQSGFTVQSEMEFTPHDYLEISNATDSIVQELLRDITNRFDVAVSKYVKYGLYRNFTTLYSYQKIPMIFTGVGAYGYREVVFSFDIHDSKFEMYADFVILMRNLWQYSFPQVVEKTVYYSGEEVKINPIPNCKSIRVDSPTGKVSYLDLSANASVFTPQEVGVYTVTVTGADAQKTYHIYSALPESERDVEQTQSAFDINGEFDASGLDAFKDVILFAFIILALTFIADWGVYCYDKYQLR